MVQIDQLVQKNDKFQTRGQTLTDGIQEASGSITLISINSDCKIAKGSETQ